jgi:hypothetical protein
VSVALAQNIDQDHNKTTILFFVCICLACGNISQKRFIFDVWTRVGFVDVSVEMYRKRPSLVNYHCIVVKTSLYHDACVVIIHDMCSIWARIYWLVQRTFVTLLVVNTMLVPRLEASYQPDTIYETRCFKQSENQKRELMLTAINKKTCFRKREDRSI